MDNRIYLIAPALFIMLNSIAATPMLSHFKPEGKKYWNTEANKFIHSIPEYERSPFLIVSLAIGLQENWPTVVNQLRYPSPKIPQDLDVSEELFEKFKDMTVPPTFRRNLVEWVMNTFQLTPVEVMKFCLKDQLCLPDGSCFDTGDVGDLCCPF